MNLITHEVAKAYSDNLNRRQLMFRASRPVARDEAIEILNQFVPSYNNFEPKLLKFLPADCLVTIAREYSVCVYVNRPIAPTKKLIKNMLVNEWDIQGNETRIWWD